MTDYIVAEGTSGDWYYRKWASGFAECWSLMNKTITTSDYQASSSSLAFYYVTASVSFPFTMNSAHLFSTYRSGYNTLSIKSSWVGTAEAGLTALFSANPADNPVYISLYLCGTWE